MKVVDIIERTDQLVEIIDSYIRILVEIQQNLVGRALTLDVENKCLSVLGKKCLAAEDVRCSLKRVAQGNLSKGDTRASISCFVEWMKSELLSGRSTGGSRVAMFSEEDWNLLRRGLTSEYAKYLNDRLKSIVHDVRSVIKPSGEGIISERPILLLCALTKERDAVREKVAQIHQLFYLRRDGEYFSIVCREADNTIAILSTFGTTGNTVSRIATGRLVRICNPKLVILFGIAAGVKKRIQIGDTLITHRVFDLRKKKMLKNKFEFEPAEISSLKHYEIPFNIGKLQKDLAAISEEEYEFVTDLLCGSCDEVVVTSSYMRDAAKTNRKLGAVENEAAGVAEACNSYRIPFFIVKAISDYGGPKKSDTYHELCCNNAGHIVIHGFTVHHAKKVG